MAILMGYSAIFVFFQFLPRGYSLPVVIGLIGIYYATVRFGVAQRSKIDNSLQHIVFAEKIEWDWRKINPRFLLLAPVIGIVLSILGYSVVGETELAERSILPTSIFGTLAYAIFVIILGGIVTGSVQTRTRPNQGMWQSFTFANRITVASGIVFLSSPVVATLEVPLALAFPMMSYNSFFFLPTIWLLSGGAGPLYHFLMRRVLERDGLIPHNMAHFLDFCASLILMRKVGGSYIFIHRALLEYFAAL